MKKQTRLKKAAEKYAGIVSLGCGVEQKSQQDICAFLAGAKWARRDAIAALKEEGVGVAQVEYFIEQIKKRSRQ